MKSHFVLASFDLYCLNPDSLPSYRVFVNDELFADRTWNWGSDFYINQTLQIQAPPGEYTVSVYPGDVFAMKNPTIDHGPAQWNKNRKLVIKDES